MKAIGYKPSYSVSHTKRRFDGAPPANPSFGTTVTKLLKAVIMLYVTHRVKDKLVY